MRFQEWGEENFIQELAANFPAIDALVGIGDDAAVIPAEKGMAWLVTTDALVEGVHFLKEQIPPRELGYKSIAVSVSDITAMGGVPKYAFLSIALPKAVECAWMRSVMEGVKEACDKWDILLLGGDTVGSKRDVFLNVALIGSGVIENIKYRNSAEVGDLICVSGFLGDSGGGLKVLQEEVVKTDDIASLLHAHFHPEPHPEQGAWLAEQRAVHAMMDVSDGLDCDLRRLIKSSKKGANVEISKIPISETLARVSAKNGWDALQLALTGGEDYCLIVVIAKEAFDGIQHAFQQQFGSRLFEIGYITSAEPEITYHREGKVISMHCKNYDHFQ